MRYSLNEQGRYDIPDTYVLDEDEGITSKMFTDLTIELNDMFEMWK